MTTTTTTATDPAGEDYTSGEGLRALLNRLHDAGPGAWEDDPVAAELMIYAADKYTPLARKHGLDPWEAASAAFDVMRTRAAREADDPWAVVTHAVRITCIAEERGQGLLCSVHQARRPHVSCFHDPERLSERENTLSDYHPAFHVTDPHHHDNDEVDADVGEPASVTGAVEDAILLFMLLGWPEGTAARRSSTSAKASPGSGHAPAPMKRCAATGTPAPCSMSPLPPGRCCCGCCWAARLLATG